MTGPVINPWWLYLYNVVGSVHVILEVFLILGVIALIAIGFVWLLASCDMCDDILEIVKKVFKRLAIALAFIIGAYILVPSQDLLMKMFILDNITYENLKTVGGITKEGFDYVIESIDELINQTEEDE